MTTTKNIIIEVLQQALAGKLNDNNVNPAHIADAIIDKIIFGTSNQSESVSQFSKILSTQIQSLYDENKKTLSDLDDSEKDKVLISNFLKGKMTAQEEVIHLIIKNLKNDKAQI